MFIEREKKMADITRKIASVLRAASDSAEPRKGSYNTAIIAAAGSGRRAGGSKAKQLVPVCGLPVVVRTMKAFEECEHITSIVLVGREEEQILYRNYVTEHKFTKIRSIVTGGEDRQTSVYNGFLAIPDETEYVLIHDGARCLITPDMITRVLAAAQKYNAACAACRAKDTPKIADDKQNILDTPDRASMWMAQTPQVFKTELYRAAVTLARRDGVEATDDCMLAERLGFNVKLVDCGYQNMKITTAEDFAIAEAILAFRAKEDAE